jgi:hypothetical protein
LITGKSEGAVIIVFDLPMTLLAWLAAAIFAVAYIRVHTLP